MIRNAVFILATLALVACARPESNERALARIGEQLFHDARLSLDGVTSCVSCHDPERAFADGRPVSLGVFDRPGTRNAPSLLDLDSVETFFWDGRETDLHLTLLQPFTNPVELGLDNMQDVVETVQAIPAYRTRFSKVIGRRSLDAEDIARALAAYLDSLDRGVTRYERAIAENDPAELSEDERIGLALFQGKAQCAACHVLDSANTSLTDHRFHHAGIGFDRIAGNIASLIVRIEHADQTDMPLGRLILEDREVAELGRFVATRKAMDIGAFRTPSLRNVANTAPYMHDGSVATLDDAIERELYYRGIALGRPITLTVAEQKQLSAFLETLSVE